MKLVGKRKGMIEIKKKLKVLDLFAGTRSIARAFEARGHETFSIDFDETHADIDWYVDMFEVTAEDIIQRFGKPDVIWASPDCRKFSVAAIGKHWIKGTNLPKTEETKQALALLEHTVQLIKDLDPKFYFIENPRGKMRKMDVLQDLPRYTLSYCQYGDFRMKPTDIWTNHPEPNFKPACKNGDPCHVAAPRGSQTGTQGIKGAVDRSRIPDKLTDYIVDISTSYTLFDINNPRDIVVDEEISLRGLKDFINGIFDGEEDEKFFTSSFQEIQERLVGIGYAAEEW